MMVNPVMLPPGRESESTIPIATASEELVMTIGMRDVALLTARADAPVVTIMTSTFPR